VVQEAQVDISSVNRNGQRYVRQRHAVMGLPALLDTSEMTFLILCGTVGGGSIEGG